MRWKPLDAMTKEGSPQASISFIGASSSATPFKSNSLPSESRAMPIVRFKGPRGRSASTAQRFS